MTGEATHSRPGGPQSAQLVLMRHGESVSNAAGSFSGWRDVPLTDEGRNQAVAAGKALAASLGAVDVVISSRLQRARETAEGVLRGLGQSEIGVCTDWRLNERHCGVFQGRTKDEVRKDYGVERLRAFRRCWGVRPPLAQAGSLDDPAADPRYADVAVALPRGEALCDIVERLREFRCECLSQYLAAATKVLIVGHAISLRALAYVLEESSDQSLPDLHLGNTATRCYRVRSDGSFELVSVASEER